MKKLVLAIVCSLSVMTASAAAAETGVSVDGKQMNLAASPQIINDCVMVPARALMESFGAKVTWDAEKSAVIAVKDARYVELRVGNDYMYHGVCKDGEDDGERVYTTSTKLDSAPAILDGVMVVPARAVSEAFYYDVEWDSENNAVSINSKGEADGWIYYASWSDGAHMYKIDTNGQNRQMLTASDCCASGYKGRFSVIKDYIYFNKRNEKNSLGLNDDILYRIKTDGTGEEQVSDGPAVICDTDEQGNLYYVEEDDDKEYRHDERYLLKKLDAETGEKTQIIDKLVSGVQIYKDYIYFQYADMESLKTAYSYFRMNRDGSDIINVTGDIPVGRYAGFDINEIDEKLIFSSSGHKLYRTDLDGSNLEEVSSPIDEDENSYSAIRKRYDDMIESAKDDGTEIYIGRKGEEVYIVDTEGNELFKGKLPQEVSIYDLDVVTDDAVFYNVEDGYCEPNIFFAGTIDELAGMNHISVSRDKQDGKYEITDEYGYDRYIPGENDGVYKISAGDSEPVKILDKYYLIDISDGKLVLAAMQEIGSDEDDFMIYTANKDGSGIEEFMTVEEYWNMKYTDYANDYNLSQKQQLKLYENVQFGTIVYNDGTTEKYYGDIY